ARPSSAPTASHRCISPLRSAITSMCARSRRAWCAPTASRSRPHLSIDRGDHLPFYQLARMGRLRAIVWQIYFADLPGIAPMVAIPVFPSRVHRHSAIYVRGEAGIRSAKDLEGRAVGIPEWAQTAGIYVRGFLAEEEGVDLAKIRWLQAGVNEPGRAEKVQL